MRKYNLPIFIPHRGCPHDCAFCNQRKITGIDTEITADVVRHKIREFLATIDKDNSSVEIAFLAAVLRVLILKHNEVSLRLQENLVNILTEYVCQHVRIT